MIEDLFKESLSLSELLRPQYTRSLGTMVNNWEDVFKKLNISVPELFRAIYGNVSGTKRDIKEQKFMDYTPGYRLVHILEIIQEKDNINSIITDEKFLEGEIVLPILANYSSDFICYYKRRNGEENICSLMNDSGELVLMYNYPEKLFETVCEFYKQGVFFLDADGYLDYDMYKEGIVGSAINHGIPYWTE